MLYTQQKNNIQFQHFFILNASPLPPVSVTAQNVAAHFENCFFFHKYCFIVIRHFFRVANFTCKEKILSRKNFFYKNSFYLSR